MKFSFFFLLLIIVSPAFAISLGYGQKEYLFEPNKKINFNYIVINTKNVPVEISNVVAAGQLTKYLILPPEKVNLQPIEHKTRTLSVILPPELPSGAYPINLEVTETQGKLRSGAKITLMILNPFETGHPYGELRLDPPKDNQINYMLTLRNIGKTPLKISSNLKMEDDNKLFRDLNLPEMIIQPFENDIIRGTVNIENIPPGEYTFRTVIENEEISLAEIIGKPGASITEKITVKANKENTFTLPINIEWNKPIITPVILLLLKNDREYLLKKTWKTLTLNPGTNNIQIADFIKEAPSGEYKAQILATKPAPFKIEFIVNVDSDTTDTSLNDDTYVSGRATYNLLKQKKVSFLVISLSIALACFLIYIALYRKNEKAEL